MKQGMLTAVQVPLCVAQIANEMWPYMKELAQIGNMNCKSDLQVNDLWLVVDPLCKCQFEVMVKKVSAWAHIQASSRQTSPSG